MQTFTKMPRDAPEEIFSFLYFATCTCMRRVIPNELHGSYFMVVGSSAKKRESSHYSVCGNFPLEITISDLHMEATSESLSYFPFCQIRCV